MSYESVLASESARKAQATFIIPGTEGLGSEAFCAKWLSLALASRNLRAFHQTPQWCAHKILAGENIELAVKLDDSGEIIGITPLAVTTVPLPFDIGSTRLCQKTFRARFIIGNLPLLTPSNDSYDELFRVLCATSKQCECLCFWGLPTDSPLFSYLTTSSEVAGAWYFYLPYGTPRYHWLNLPVSFSEYLAKFSSKTRNTLRRKVNKLKAAGSVELKRVEVEHDLPEFVNAATRIAENSWQLLLLNIPVSKPLDRIRSLCEIAKSGLMRSYVLMSDGTACAFVMGFQLGDTFVFFETAFDERYSDQSPGQVILYLLIEDLISYRRPERLFFGTGDEDYKAFFGNAIGVEANIVLIRRSISNWMWWRLHMIYRGGVGMVKRLFRKS